MSSTLSDTTRDTARPARERRDAPSPPRQPCCRTRSWSRPCWRWRWRWATRWCARSCSPSRSSASPSSSAGRPSGSALDNYRDAGHRRLPVAVTLRSVAFCLVNAALTMVIGVGVALLMRQMSAPSGCSCRPGCCWPGRCRCVAALTVWQWLFDTQYGVVNWLLTRLGLDYEGHSWLLEPLSFFFVATVIVVWMSVPFVAFTVYAALTQVPEELVEAAEIDGAGAGSALPARRAADHPAGAAGRRAAADHLGPARLHPDLRAAEGRRQSPATPTCSAPTSTGSASAAASSARPRRWRSSCWSLTVVLTAPYVRAMLRQEGEATMSRADPPRPCASPPTRRASLVVPASARSRSTGWSTRSFLPRHEIRARPDLGALRRRPRQLPHGLRTATSSSTRSRISLMVTGLTVVVRAGLRVPGRRRGDPVPVPRPA